MTETVDMDKFAMTLSSMLNIVEDGLDSEIEPAVRASSRLAAREWKKNAPVKTGRYKSGVKSTVKKRGKHASFGETGVTTSPGLAHLLEKGHARVGGGRNVAPRVHIAPAAEVAFADFEKRIKNGISKAMR